MSNVERAIALATDAHAGQVDKLGVTYILHPLRVMLAFADPVDQTVAVLHDVVEDTDVTLDDLRSFGTEVVDAVDALTRRKDEVYMDFVHRAAKNPRAKRVKIQDIYDNLDRLTPELMGMEARYTKALAFLMGG